MMCQPGLGLTRRATQSATYIDRHPCQVRGSACTVHRLSRSLASDASISLPCLSNSAAHSFAVTCSCNAVQPLPCHAVCVKAMLKVGCPVSCPNVVRFVPVKLLSIVHVACMQPLLPSQAASSSVFVLLTHHLSGQLVSNQHCVRS